MSIHKQASLYYKDNRSDKEYHLQLNSNGYGYTVTSQYGPRGGTLVHVDLTKGQTVTWLEATNLFQKKETEKRAKGYKDAESKLAKRLTEELPFFVTPRQANILAEWIERYVEEQVYVL